MMTLTDTHTHIYSEEFQHDRDAMMQRAFDAGVTRLFVPSIDSEYTQQMYDLQEQYPDNVFLMMGLHPTYVRENYKDELAHVERELASRKFAAVGEIGIDLYWDKTRLADQQFAFKYQIQLAKKYKLPINIHCRDAFNEVFEVLEQEQDDDLRGIFHCFTGNLEQAQKVISLGFYLGIGGVVTYKNAGLDKILPEIDLSHIVLETDSPYLTPVPHRGKPNESSYLIYVAQKVADVYQVTLDVVADITTANSKKIFGV